MIYDFIGEEDRYDFLRVATRVCRSWHATFSNLLYRHPNAGGLDIGAVAVESASPLLLRELFSSAALLEKAMSYLDRLIGLADLLAIKARVAAGWNASILASRNLRDLLSKWDPRPTVWKRERAFEYLVCQATRLLTRRKVLREFWLELAQSFAHNAHAWGKREYAQSLCP